MTVKDFLEEDKKLYERENKLLAEQHRIRDKRADLSIALDKEKHSAIWAELEGKALKDTKGTVWTFKKLEKIQGDWYVTLTYSKKGEITADMDRHLSGCLEWVASHDMQLVDAPIDAVVKRLIEEREKIVSDDIKRQEELFSRLEENDKKYNELPEEGLKEFLLTHAVHDKDSGLIYTARNPRKTPAGWRVDVTRYCEDDETESDAGSWPLLNLLGLVDKNSNIELIEYEVSNR